MKKMYALTHDDLLAALGYDSATGIFTWKLARSNRVKIGDRAGVVHKPTGGRYIALGNEKFMAHRLAWFYVNGKWPDYEVRPLDENYDNCAISNLVEISKVDLAHRRKGTVKTNTTGFPGVSPARFGKFQASFTWEYKQISLGAYFETPQQAAVVREAALDQLKAAQSDTETEAAFARILLSKRQRTAWANLVRQGIKLGWSSFEEFAETVTNLPPMRYAMSAIDQSKPIGPRNYRWSSHGDLPTHTAEGRKAYRSQNRDQMRDKDFRKKYGIDFAEYQRMLVEQNGVCACCERPETRLTDAGDLRMLSVDHDHTTSAVRELLCSNCNLVMGYACDDVTVLQKAIAYLKKHDPSNVVKFEPSVINGALGNGT